MPRKAATPPRTGRSSAVPNLSDPTTSRAVQAVSTSVGAIEREHVGAGGDAHALVTDKRPGFAPALQPGATRLLDDVDLAAIVARLEALEP